MTTPIKTLNVIADGEPCMRRKNWHTYFFYEGDVYREEFEVAPAKRLINGEPVCIDCDAIVQPVRIEEVGHG